MKVAVAQINPTVGDISGNSHRIQQYINQAADQAADLVVFPELSLVGYPPKDLLLKQGFIDENIAALDAIAQNCRTCAALVGFVCRHQDRPGRPLHNAAALLANGRVQQLYYKRLLPTYDVFDETRYFEPADAVQVIDFAGRRIGLTICEDIWNYSQGEPRSQDGTGSHSHAPSRYQADPFADLAAEHVDFVINMSASPFVIDKHKLRCDLFTRQCRRHKLPLVYVNQVGGNDELLFDGASCAFDRHGNRIAQARAFEEDLLLIDLDHSKTARIEQIAESVAAVGDALVMGLRDYVQKCGFSSVVLGLSGGIDSAVTAALATQALGSQNVLGVAMPSRFSSTHSLADAEQLAGNLGTKYMTIPIEPAQVALESMLQDAFSACQPDITEENIQARIRANILMALSNKFNHLLLTTGNKSELAVGYCTIYGDMAGGLAVISDVPKTMVYQLAQHINADAELIPQSSITKPPSAELRADQTDQDSLPPYDQLDEILYRYVEQEQSPSQITAAGFDQHLVERVIDLVDRSEYKRKQAAPGLKVTSRAFGSGRRMPIAQKYRPRPNQKA